MQVTIDEHGVLRVSAETSLEAFALKKWSESATHEVIGCVTGPDTTYIRSDYMVIDFNHNAVSAQQGKEK
jgi:hypothetical protein